MTQEFRDPVASAEPFRLGNWLVEPSLNRLSRDDATIQLELKVMDVLVCLAERAGEVVPRQEIVDRVWATEFISDNTLTHAVTELRNALGDDARNPSFIETIHRRGYRLIASVEATVSDEAGESRVARFPVRERAVSPDVERSPYPGLAAFTEEDAEFFFGREAEVTQMWRKLTSRKLLAVIGPSGVGKSSFLRAGVIPARPEGWGVLVCQPSEAPFGALARALVPEFAGDIDATAQLVDIRDGDRAVAMVSRWRDRHQQALFILDQFEELFTLNPREIQASYSDVLRRLVDDADVHVLLAMRDDFLFHIHDHPTLAPVLNQLTLLGAPSPESLRLALVEPARRLGFIFEDEDLPGGMIAEVEGERGALPLLAFAVARLWDKRDADRRLLTNRAYADIGGVGGALASHADATLKAIGDEGVPIVREIFRNLVTAEGTRAVRESDDLLTVFPESQQAQAEQVLRRLVDARLLTSFEEEDVEGDGRRRVEVVHETLLSSWPRLVRWQTQDADSARLRDQLRQAARTWDEHDRSDDLLWAGSTFREFEVWRENYPGGLTELEEDFASAMISHAKRRKRRRRIAMAAFLVIAALVATVTTALWRRSVVQERRAEAQKLIALGQVRLEDYPTATLAHATRSLELADSEEARLLALKALWEGPTAFIVNEIPSFGVGFTPDGQWLVQTTDAAPYRVHRFGADGSDELLEDVHNGWANLRMDLRSGVFATSPAGRDPKEPFALWSAPDKKLLAKGRAGYPENVFGMNFDLKRQRVLLMVSEEDQFFLDALRFDGTSVRLGELPFDSRSFARCSEAPDGEWTAVLIDQEVHLIEFGDHEISEPRRLSHIQGPVVDIECDPLGRFVAARYEGGLVRLWDLDGSSPPREIQGPLEFSYHSITADGTMLEAVRFQDDQAESWIWSLESKNPTLLRKVDLGTASGYSGWELNTVERQLVSVFNADGKIRLWPLAASADSEPLILGKGDIGQPRGVTIHPGGAWAASSFTDGLTLWPIVRSYPTVIEQYDEQVANLAFAPDGRWLAASSVNASGTVRMWRLEGDALPPARIIHEAETFAYGLSVSPSGNQVLLGKFYGVDLLFLDGTAPRSLPGAGMGFVVGGVAISPDGRFGAASTRPEDSDSVVITVWDLASNEVVGVFDTRSSGWERLVHFSDDGCLLSAGMSGLIRWNVETGGSEVILNESFGLGVVSSNGSRAILMPAGMDTGIFPVGPVIVHDLDTGLSTPLASHGDQITSFSTDANGAIVVTGDDNGVIRIGNTTGEEPHLFLGSRGKINGLAVDPLGRWIASSGQDNAIRLWPMPDLSKPPLHTLPYDELIAKLKTLTNLRVVRDEESATGWKLTHDPFPGWETVPTW